jgi:hypothetical protein
MAIAATDFVNVKRTPMGPRYLVTGKYVPSGTYTAAGEAITKAIARKGLGISQIDAMGFGGLMSADFATYSQLVFDGARTASIEGKIHIINAVPAHTHTFLVKGGTAAAGTDALNIKGTTPVTIGKEAATDATNLGGAGGGVQANTAATVSSEVATASDYSTADHYSYFWAVGR